MRKVRAAVAIALLVPALSGLSVVTPSFAVAEPVAPDVQSIPIAGVEPAASGSRELPRSAEAAVDAREELVAQALTSAPAPQRAPEPFLLTRERETDTFETVGVTWDYEPDALDVTVVLRTRSEEGWSPWQALDQVEAVPLEGADPAALRAGTEPAWVGESDAVQVRVDVWSGAAPQDVRLTLVDPGDSAFDAQAGAQPAAAADAAAGRPTIYTRAQWGADESRRGSPTYMTTIGAGTLHHTAGRNGYTSEEVPGIIRGDYAYHLSLGWSDLGYNFVVDRFGRIWEGRAGGVDRAVQGAHAGGFNTHTFGVSVLGNYTTTTTTSTSPLVDSLARLFAWKLGLHHRDPAGRITLTAASGSGTTSKYPGGTRVSLPSIFGHRDVGSTSCPGQLYDMLGTIRSKATAYTGYAPVTPTVTWSASSVRVQAGQVNPASWQASLVSASGQRVASVRGSAGAVDTTLALRAAGGGALPGGTYHVVLEMWSGSSAGQPWVSATRTIQGPSVSEVSEVGAARLANGSLVVARTTSDGGVQVRTAGAGGSLGSPVSLGGVAVGAPSVAVQADGTPVVLVRGGTNALYLKRRLPDGSWPSEWVRGPAGLGGRPAGVATGTGAGLEVFARSTQGPVTWFTWSSSGRWTSRSVGGGVAADTGVGVTRTGDGVLHLAVQGTDRQAWYRSYAGGRWSSLWSPLGGELRSDVGVAAASDRAAVVVGLGTNGHAYSRMVGDGAAVWTRVSTAVTPVAPAVVEPRAGRYATVLVVDSRDAVQTRDLRVGTWSPTARSAGLGEALPVGGARLPDGSVLVARTTGAGTVEVWSGASFATLGQRVLVTGAVRGAPAVAVLADGTPVLAVRGTDDVLYLKRRLPDGTWPARWEKGPVGVAGRPELVPAATGAGLDVFAPSARGDVVWSTSTGPGRWTSRSAGGAVARGTGVGAARTVDGAVHLAVQGTDGQGWYARYAGGRWGSWLPLGGGLRADVGLSVASTTTVLATAAGTNDLPYTMLIGSGARTWTRWSASASAAWPSITEPTGSSPATVLRPNGRGELESQTWGGDWSWGDWSAIS